MRRIHQQVFAKNQNLIITLKEQMKKVQNSLQSIRLAMYIQIGVTV